MTLSGHSERPSGGLQHWNCTTVPLAFPGTAAFPLNDGCTRGKYVDSCCKQPQAFSLTENFGDGGAVNRGAERPAEASQGVAEACFCGIG